MNETVTCSVPAGFTCKVEAVWSPEHAIAVIVIFLLFVLILGAALLWGDRHGR